jgi:hypothetical protein
MARSLTASEYFTCVECVRLSAERFFTGLALSAARDDLRMTPMSDPAYADRQRKVERLHGQFREASRQEDAHRDGHGHDPRSLVG